MGNGLDNNRSGGPVGPATWHIDYDAVMASATRSAVATEDALKAALAKVWLDAYKQSVPHIPQILAICIDGFEYLFDSASADTQPKRILDSDLICERVVAVHGVSKQKTGRARPASRIRGFPRGAAVDSEVVDSVRHDRGHFAAHASGGEEDINLFPQLTDLNRGWSLQGRRYRQMERVLAAKPGTYFFSRPIYTGPTDHPFMVEFGLLLDNSTLRVERFDNCRSLEEMRAIEAAVASRMRST